MRTRWSTLTLFWLNGSGENLHICGRISSKKEVARVRINPSVELSLFYRNNISQRSAALGIITVMIKKCNHGDKGYCMQMRRKMRKYFCESRSPLLQIPVKTAYFIVDLFMDYCNTEMSCIIREIWN